ncbi:hypothetical protein HYQ46_002208 [Verticillium longisporum]|nr:hypothetical protein HYQ46_002208 [Verticillium longisporum]
MGGPSSDSESEESKSKNEADGAADDGSQGARRQGGRGAERGWTRSARLVEGKLGSVDLTVVGSETREPPIVRVEEVDVRGSMANEDDWNHNRRGLLYFRCGYDVALRYKGWPQLRDIPCLLR